MNPIPALMQRGRDARRANDRAAAIDAFRAVLAADPRHVNARLELAHELIHTGTPAEAAVLCRGIIDQHPAHAQAHHRLGEALRSLGDRAGAHAAFTAAVAADPAHPWARLELAADALHAGNPADAARLARAVIADDSTLVAAYLRLVEALRRQGDHAGVEAALANAVRLAPGHVGARLELAAALAARGRHDLAEAELRTVLAAAPNHVGALLRLAELARHNGDTAGAEAALRTAVGTDPNHLTARLELARALADAGDLGAAEAHYRDAIARHPTQAATHLRLGDVLRRRNDRTGALAAAQAAVAAEPAHRFARLALAAALADAGCLADARSAVASVLAEDPAEPAAWTRRGAIERAAGDHAAALQAYRRAAALRPDDPQPLVEIAIESRALGRPAESERALAAALARGAGHLPALVQLAEHALLAEDARTAAELAARALALRPDHLPAHLVAIRATLAADGHAAALRHLQAVPDPTAARPELLVLRFVLLRQLGRLEGAAALLETLPPADRDHPALWFNAVLLDLAEHRLDATEARLAAHPADRHDAAGLHMARGLLADARGHLPAAIEHFQAAVAQNPDSPGPHGELARAALLATRPELATAHLREWVRLNTPARLLRGQSLNHSQTHTGQLLDELLLDRAVLAELERLAPHPPAARIAPLLALVRDNPDHTPAAVALLLALRATGRLPGLGAGGHAPDVPPRIAQYWSDPEPPADITAMLRTWPAHHPRHVYTRFDDAAARAWLAAHAPPDAARAYARADHPAQQADLFRLAWLHAEGGLWADADDRCRAPLSTLLAQGTRFVAYLEEYGTLGNNLLLAAPADPVIARALRDGTAAVLRGDRDMLWLSTGPGLITRAFAAELAAAPDPDAWLRGRVILERGELTRAVAMHCAVDYKRTGRHWMHSRRATRRVAMAAPAGQFHSG